MWIGLALFACGEGGLGSVLDLAEAREELPSLIGELDEVATHLRNLAAAIDAGRERLLEASNDRSAPGLAAEPARMTPAGHA